LLNSSGKELVVEVVVPLPMPSQVLICWNLQAAFLACGVACWAGLAEAAMADAGSASAAAATMEPAMSFPVERMAIFIAGQSPR
jgi:hypothetical protein